MNKIIKNMLQEHYRLFETPITKLGELHYKILETEQKMTKKKEEDKQLEKDIGADEILYYPEIGSPHHF